MRVLHLSLGAVQLLAGCRPSPALPELTVVGTDYAFMAPDTVPPGERAVSFTNQGTVLHEVITPDGGGAHLSVLSVEDRVLLLLGADDRVLIGDPSWSYVLNRGE